ncbi:hypothetical protein Q0601_22150 [Paracoccus onubensis]|uniref:hypothetical protein n=1 Tax=Paracoccus onubensis TaxID=1675788 RepID=UPI002730149B|nr:hypothetical protein [Paracoccus onubensis]MDP0929894.1 hypothetical protein [Paracoccus onubensis]
MYEDSFRESMRLHGLHEPITSRPLSQDELDQAKTASCGDQVSTAQTNRAPGKRQSATQHEMAFRIMLCISMRHPVERRSAVYSNIVK